MRPAAGRDASVSLFGRLRRETYHSIQRSPRQ